MRQEEVFFSLLASRFLPFVHGSVTLHVVRNPPRTL
jgi:hypothetical protein